MNWTGLDASVWNLSDGDEINIGDYDFIRCIIEQNSSPTLDVGFDAEWLLLHYLALELEFAIFVHFGHS